jgi:hypothetical protein
MTYRRIAERTKNYDSAQEWWQHTLHVTLIIKRDGEEIGRLNKTVSHKEGFTWGYRRKKWQGSKFYSNWDVNILGRNWTIPWNRTRAEVLEEIKRKSSIM